MAPYAEFRRYKGADLYLFAARATCPRQFATNRPPDWTRADFLADDGPVGLPRALEIGHRPVAMDTGLSIEREHPAPGEHVYVRLALYGRDEAAVGPFLRLAGGADEARRRAEGRIGITSDPYPPEAQAREWLFHLAAPVLDLPRDPAPVELARVALAPFTREAPPDVERAMGVRRGIIYPDVFHLSCRAIERLLGGEPEPREPWTLRSRPRTASNFAFGPSTESGQDPE